ncbi:MAG: porin [Leptothrix sp. (in: b-proteobacteria)]
MTAQIRFSALTAAALLTIAAAPTTAFAQAADFTWYGRIDLAAESNNNGAVSRLAVQNFSSRLGVKGERKFTDSLSGIFQVETGVAPDDTTQSKTFASRNSFVGLKSAAAGTLIVGTHDMPLKSLEGTAYALWGEADLQEMIIHGKGSASTIGSTFGNVHTRKTNVLLYTSPKLANAVVAKLAFSPDEAKAPADATNPSFNKQMLGASVEYNDGTFNAGLATQQQKQFNGAPAVAAVTASPTRLAVNAVAAVPGTTMKGTKLTFGAKMDAWTAGIAFSKLDNSAGNATKNVIVVGTYALTSDTTLKASLGKSSESKSGAQDGLRAMAIEADYALDKQTTAYTYLARVSTDAKSKATFYAADNFPATSAAGKDPRALGLGIRYNF